MNWMIDIKKLQRILFYNNINDIYTILYYVICTIFKYLLVDSRLVK